MTHDIHISFDNLNLQNTGLQVKRGDYDAHILNFIFDNDLGADNYRIRLKNANGEASESVTLDTPFYRLGAFDVSCGGIVNAELSAYTGDSRLTSATFTYEVLNDISTDEQIIADDRYPILDELIKKAEGSSVSGMNEYNNSLADHAARIAELELNSVTKEELDAAIQTAVLDSWEAAV